MCKAGLRVDVFDGSGKNHLGQGTIVGFVDVYIMRDGLGISSATNAETKPDEIPDDAIEKITGNPKILLDSGKTVYGCQTWWKPIDEPKEVQQ